MNVTDFFHFQAAFHGDRIVNTAADKEYISGGSLFRRKPLEPLLIFNNFLNLFRKGLHLSDQAAICLFRYLVPNQGALNGQTVAGN